MLQILNQYFEMNYPFALVIQVSWLLLLDITTTITDKPICLTWNAIGRDLTIECSVQVVKSKNSISIVDPFGNNRVHCTLSESIKCSGSDDHVLREDILENIKTLTLMTVKHNADGEWKCQYGKEEARSYISYTEGNFPMVDLAISGEIWKTKDKNGFKLTCVSCLKPYNDGADFYVNNELEDSIRYQDGLCYHKRNVCSSEKCTCLSRGKRFSWIFISNLEYIQFTCAMRFKDTATISIYKTDLIYNGSDFIQNQKTNTSISYADKSLNITYEEKEKTDNSGHIGYSILGTSVLIITVILSISFWNILKRRSKQAIDKKEKTMDELVPLQHLQSRDSRQSCDVTCRIKDINIACLYSHQSQETKYTQSLIINLKQIGLRSNQITLINDSSPDRDFSKALKIALKLLIVIPEKYKSSDNNFHMLVKKAIRLFKENPSSDILPIIRSKKAALPECLRNLTFFSSLEQKLKMALMRCTETEETDSFVLSFRNMFNIVMANTNLREIVIPSNVHEHLTGLGLEVLKGWGVEIEKNRVSFHINTLQSLSRYHHIYLHDLTACLFRGRTFGFLRLYDVFKFDLSDLQLHENMYNQLNRIFKMIIDMKGKKWWYHYRRNGLSCTGSSEGAFILVKQVFLSQKCSAIFHQFKTYESRLCTFRDYPIENKSYREKLALAGFFYYNVSDYVQCFHCGGCLRAWKSMCDPMKRHKETFKTCHFACNTERKEISILDAEPATYDSIHTEKDRLNSFKSFPDTRSNDDLKQLAHAGFYYCGIAEDIVCSACNIGFASVENSEYIFRLHNKYSQKCPNIPKCENYAMRSEPFDPKCISNFVQYLELEYRKHDF